MSFRMSVHDLYVLVSHGYELACMKTMFGNDEE